MNGRDEELLFGKPLGIRKKENPELILIRVWVRSRIRIRVRVRVRKKSAPSRHGGGRVVSVGRHARVGSLGLHLRFVSFADITSPHWPPLRTNGVSFKVRARRRGESFGVSTSPRSFYHPHVR